MFHLVLTFLEYAVPKFKVVFDHNIHGNEIFSGFLQILSHHKPIKNMENKRKSHFFRSNGVLNENRCNGRFYSLRL